MAAGLLCAASAIGQAARAQAPAPIVVVMSYSGGATADRRGYAVISGVKAYFGRVNAHGGVGGRQLVIETFDDRGDPRLHADGVRRLVREKGAVAILGCVGDAICEASAGVAAELHVPLVAALSGSATLSRERNPYVFRVRAEALRELDAVAVQLAQLACTRVAVLSDRSAGSESDPVILDALRSHGLKATLVRVDALTPAGLEGTLRALGGGDYQAVLTNLAPHTVDLFVDAGLSARDEWPSVLMTTANGDLMPLAAGFKGRVVGFTQVVPNAELIANPLARELNEDAERYSGSTAVTPQGMEGYIGARLLVDALRKAGPKANAEQLFTALSAIDDLSLDGFHLAFGKGRKTGSDWVEIGLRSRAGFLVN